MQSGNYEYQSEFARKYVAQGREEGLQQGLQEGRYEGERAALFEVLDARGLEVDDATRQRILACSEQEQLNLWLRRAVTAKSVRELFEEGTAARPAAKRARGSKAPKSRSKR